MKTNSTPKLATLGCLSAFAVLCLTANAAVTVVGNIGTTWTNDPPYVVATYDPPSAATTGENNYNDGTAPGTYPHPFYSLAQTFSLPGTNTYTLTNIQLSVSGAPCTNYIYLYDLGTTNNTATSPQSYKSVTVNGTSTALNLFSSGLNFVYNGGGSQATLQLTFSGADAVTLTGGHRYVFEIDPDKQAGVMTWNRGGASPPYNLGAAYRSEGNLNGGGNQREFAMAVSFVGVSNLINTNFVVTIQFPAGSSYGPPTSWPYYTGIAAGTASDGVNTDESFNSSNPIMGETFTPRRDFQFRNVYIACLATTNTGTYLLHLYDLGTGSTTNFNHPLNLGPNNLFSNAVTRIAFSPTGLTNRQIIKMRVPSNFWQTLSNGHSYFFGLQYAGAGSNDLVWERTTGGLSYKGGTAFKGANPTAMNNNGFGGTVQNFLFAIDVYNPNPVFSVTNYSLTTSWPSLPNTTPATPWMTTFEDPFSFGGLGLNDDPVNDNAMGPANTAVLHPLNGGVAFSMSLYGTNDFHLGAIGLRQRGIGSSNVLFTVAIYDITNSFFQAANTIEKWPRNFQPNIDSLPFGVPIFRTNADFYYTADNGTNGVGQGTNDQFLILTISDPGYQVLLRSNHNYVVEFTSDTVGQNANNAGLFLLVRDIGQRLWQKDLFPDLGDGIQTAGQRTNAASANGAVLVEPRMLTRNFTEPETFAGNVVGAGSVRQMVFALYAVPAPPVNITSVTHSGTSVNLRWTSAGGTTYSVLRKDNLTDASWTVLTTDYPAQGPVTAYTDSTAAGATAFYRISVP